MNLKKLFFAFTFFIFLLGCNQQSSTNQVNQTNNTDTLFQVSTLQALMQGYYYPVSTVGELKENGDFGIGCFEAVNGELIMVDGVVYQAIHDSSILVPDNNAAIPYATVTFFNNDISFELENVSSMENLKEQLNKIVNENGNNIFYFVRIDGTFDTLYYRSEYAQKEPYKPLAKAMETDQTFFNKENETGTIVGLYCPDFMDKLNSPGWHFHFITEDKQSGGHLLNLSSKKIAVQLDKKTDFKMTLPEEEKFQQMQLSKDMSKDMIEVETK
ncbi:MAG: acetolactate decarboxylase [Endomicrobiaceae bacterium]|nr:acetolactate decarboxylase [Endomicrobiaceae bacterium]